MRRKRLQTRASCIILFQPDGVTLKVAPSICFRHLTACAGIAAALALFD